MILFRGMLIDERILTKPFACRLSACRGRCCIEGEEGAPITVGEKRLLQRELPRILPHLTKGVRKEIQRQGFYAEKSESRSIRCLPDGRCVFARWGKNGTLECVIEYLHGQGKISVPKPFSCRLYPLRLDRLGSAWVLRFDEWDICLPARMEGMARGIRAYEFVRETLIEYFGCEWYEELDALADEYLQSSEE